MITTTSDALDLSHFIGAGDGIVIGERTGEPHGVDREDFRMTTLQFRALTGFINWLEQQL